MTGRTPSSFPIPRDEIVDLVSAVVGPIAELFPLAGDASTRRFFRIHPAAGGSLVLMALEGPADSATHPQFLVGNYLESIGFPVPHLAGAVPEAGLLLYEDLGDRPLQDAALESLGPRQQPPPGNDPAAGAGRRGLSLDGLEALYREAIGLIGLLQGRGTRELTADHPSSRSFLDRERFLFELDFFREHYLIGLRGLRLGPREERALGDFFAVLAGEAAAPPRVLCHRDFHSRNLLVTEQGLRVIDFQDARLGPATYDLASLLKDSYVRLPAHLKERLMDEFSEILQTGTPGLESWRERFDIVSLQRNLKAIGTFAFQATIRGKDDFLLSIPPTWGYILETVRRVPFSSEVVPILELASGPV